MQQHLIRKYQKVIDYIQCQIGLITHHHHNTTIIFQIRQHVNLQIAVGRAEKLIKRHLPTQTI